GNSIVPSSGCRTPRIRSSRVDFPTPLRPTSPTLLPSGIWACAWSSSRRPVRPPTRYVTSERVSIAVFYHSRAAVGDERRRDRTSGDLGLDLCAVARNFLSEGP